MLVNSTFVSHTNDKVKRRAGGVRRAHPVAARRCGACDGHVASGCASYHAYSRMSCPATWPSPTPDLSYRSLHLGAVSKCTPGVWRLAFGVAFRVNSAPNPVGQTPNA